MSDIIKLLPDSVANQIAAGEVIQRPASVVKELLENAVDAGASKIDLVIKESDNRINYIQVSDNGKGMSFKDTRLCFERHATSKISDAKDLCFITTKGFRGEALASIASVARVKLLSNQDEEMGTLLLIEGSTVKTHEPAVAKKGTTFIVRDLFFNIPARYNFLKSLSIEFRHVEEEFFRVALIHSDIAFTLTKNDKILFNINASSFKQRIINLLGSHFKNKLYPVELDTDFLQISGCIGKPENAKKSRPEQYLFINNRFVKHSLLNFAIEKAYNDLIPDKLRPPYFIKININPEAIDVNISPTKTEIKLQNEQLVFGFLNSAVRKALGTMSLVPQIDFDSDKGIDFSNIKPSSTELKPPPVSYNPDYNPFSKNCGNSYNNNKNNNLQWEKFFKDIKNVEIEDNKPEVVQSSMFSPNSETDLHINYEDSLHFLIFDAKYIIFTQGNSLAIVNILNARERILYEKYLEALANSPVSVQATLFPETLVFTPSQTEILIEMKSDLLKLGYDLEYIGNNQFAVNGTPNNETSDDLTQLLSGFIDSYKANMIISRNDRASCIALTMAKQNKHRYNIENDEITIKSFLKQLLECEIPSLSPSKQKTIYLFSTSQISSFFL